jgi:hypothetical protein
MNETALILKVMIHLYTKNSSAIGAVTSMKNWLTILKDPRWNKLHFLVLQLVCCFIMDCEKNSGGRIENKKKVICQNIASFVKADGYQILIECLNYGHNAFSQSKWCQRANLIEDSE